jgi:signal peptidase I
MKSYSLRKSRSIFKEGVGRFRKLQRRLSGSQMQELEDLLDALDKAIAEKDRATADSQAHLVKDFLRQFGKKSLIDHILEFSVALTLAVAVAIVVRVMWFELYHVPTGSMRPTIKEHDQVIVSKNAFGFNIPFHTGHFLFDPDLVKRGSIIVFNVSGLNVAEPNQTYFLVFPGIRRYVKRCMGKPEDCLYFYGGRVYGVDKDGKWIPEFLDDPTFCKIEHIPFLTFEGHLDHDETASGQSRITFRHMDMPLGRLTLISPVMALPEVFDGKNWKEGKNFFTRWGMENYAMARIISKDDLPPIAHELGYDDAGVDYYLEMRHHPELPDNMLLFEQEHEHQESYFLPSYLFSRFTWLPLSSNQFDTLKKSLYTSRLQIEDGTLYRYTFESNEPQGRGVSLSRAIPNGLYEFFNGIAYKIGLFSIAWKLPFTHPIYPKSEEAMKTLFNAGIDPTPLVNPSARRQQFQYKKPTALFPERFAYFRDGDLVVMNEVLFQKNDPALKDFLTREARRGQLVSTYIPFTDPGAPTSAEFIQQHGLKVPPKHYFGLGDNHASSGDSRVFGFVPEDNMEGSPFMIIMPPGDRWGCLPQPPIPFLRRENMYVYSVVGVVGILSLWYFRTQSPRRAWRARKQKAKK